MIAGPNLSFFAEGHDRVNIAFLFQAKVGKEIKPFAALANINQEELKVDQSVEAHINLAASPAKLLAEGGEPLLMQLLEGISLEVKLNLWRKLSDLLMRIVGNCEVDGAALQILGMIAPALLLKINAHLDITIDDVMKQKIAENPLVEPVLLDAQTLIASTSGKSFETDEELFAHIEENVPQPFNEIAAIFAKHLGDTIEFKVLDEFVGLKGRISGEGLNLILRNGLKYLG